MHIVWIVLEVLGGLIALAVILAILFVFSLTKGGGNPFQ